MARRLKHLPLHPARDCVALEGIYLRLWQNFAEQRPDEWLAIFSECSFTPRQRAASVAASFMVFMGCSAGRCFTHQADRLASSGAFAWPEPAYLAQWALENKRHSYVNSGLRTIEYMLAVDYPIRSHFPGGVDWRSVPVITMDDQDVIECMVRWWCGPTARVIRAHAADVLKAHETNELLKHHLLCQEVMS